MQFHPTTLYPTGILLTEGCRGEGAYLINSEGERFMKRYAPNAMELASRDVVSRSEQTEIDAGRGINGSVMLDMRHLGAEQIIERLPASRELSMTFAGVDPIYDPMPVRPGAHYHMGGVETDNDGADRADRAVRRRRGRVRLGARREPPRRQLADGDDHLRPARRPRRRGVGALAHDDRRARAAPRRTPSASCAICSTSADGERPWQIRNDLGTSMLENFGVFRREEQMLAQERDHRRAARALRARRRDRGQGRGLQQRPDAGDRARQHARPRRVHGRRPGSRARRAAAPTRGRTTTRRATTRTS